MQLGDNNNYGCKMGTRSKKQPESGEKEGVTHDSVWVSQVSKGVPCVTLSLIHVSPGGPRMCHMALIHRATSATNLQVRDTCQDPIGANLSMSSGQATWQPHIRPCHLTVATWQLYIKPPHQELTT
jgi:hypothetical protein